MVMLSVARPVFRVTPTAWGRSQYTTWPGSMGFPSTLRVTLTLTLVLLEFLAPPPVAVACSLAGSDLNSSQSESARACAGAMVFNVPLALTVSHNQCDECGAPSRANWVSMIFSKSDGGSAPLRKTPFTKNPGVPATPTLRPCSMSASILDLNLPLLRHD